MVSNRPCLVLSLFTAIAHFVSYLWYNPAFLYVDMANTTLTLPPRPPPNVQVFVITAPSLGVSWERFYASHIGWHQDFPDIKAFTFDQYNNSNIPFSGIVESLPLMENEFSAKHSNLLMAAFQRIYELNNVSNWYFLAEDDTFVIKENLDALVETLDPQKLIVKGKHVKTKIDFAQGGAGILMSQGLLRALSPHLTVCRHVFNKGYGDVRLGQCILNHVPDVEKWFNPTAPFCFPANIFNMVNWNPTGDWRPVALHEKYPMRMRRLYEVICNITHYGNHSDPDWSTFRSFEEYWTMSFETSS